MRTKTSFIIIFIITVAGAVFAESPHEQLKQMVAQLQKSPNDNALRVKIIKSAQELKPAPAVPEEAERFEGRAQFAFKNAKSPADYLDAAKEYEKAVAAAPWVPGYYYDLCTIYEKAEKYAEAKKSCEFFLASSPSAQDASDVRKRIAGLEFAIEKANSPEARMAKEKRDEIDLGGIWVTTPKKLCWDYQFKRNGDELVIITSCNGDDEQLFGSATLNGRSFTGRTTREWRSGEIKGRISEDNRSIVMAIPEGIPTKLYSTEYKLIRK